MNRARQIGNNIGLVIKHNDLSNSEVAIKVNMSENDVLRVLSGRLLLSSSELQSFADALSVDASELLADSDSNCYNELIHCMGRITDYENVDKILGFIDSYITLEEDSRH